PNARTQAELRAVLPFLDQRRGDVVKPTAVVVPGDEDDRVGPQAAPDDRVDLVGCPLFTGLHQFDWMLAETGRSVHPGDGGKLAGGCGRRELVGGHVVLTSLERRDISMRIAAVVAPGQPGFLQCRRERGDVEWRLRLDRITVLRVVDDGRG